MNTKILIFTNLYSFYKILFVISLKLNLLIDSEPCYLTRGLNSEKIKEKNLKNNKNIKIERMHIKFMKK